MLETGSMIMENGDLGSIRIKGLHHDQILSTNTHDILQIR